LRSANVGEAICDVLQNRRLLHSVPCREQSRSQTPASPSSQDDINKQLLDRIRELESEVKELKEKQASAAPALAPEPPPLETPRPHVVADRLKLQIFGDVGFQASNQKGTTNELSRRFL
jgi:hypothetical protein